MRRATLLLVVFACAGCDRQKSTPDLIADLKSPSASEKDRIIAVRLLPQRKGDAAHTVPALAGALKDKDSGIRWSAAIGLGQFGADARETIPAIQEALKDHDARVREAAGVALHRIDPAQFAAPTPKPAKGK